MRKIDLLTVICVGCMSLAGCAHVPQGDLLGGVKPGSDGKIHCVTVFAHPDDETFYVGGTLIKLKKDPRVQLHILCLTNGNQDEAKDNLHISADELARLRLQELSMAAGVLGADSVACLNYDDQGLTGADQALLLKQVGDALRQSRADIVITNDPFGLSGHPDHITCNRITALAFQTSPAQKLYYVTMPPGRYRYNLIFALSRSQAEKSKPTVRVDIAAEKRMKRLALYSHVTQHHFSFWNGLAMSEDLLYDTEYFTLAAEKNRGE